MSKDRSVLQELTQRLNLISPVDGIFVASIGSGGFAILGDPIGIIYPKTTNLGKQTLICAAPDDVKVLELAVTRGRVHAGQLIAKLGSSQLDRLKNRLDSLARSIDIQQRPFNDGRLEKFQAILNRKADYAGELWKSAEIISQEVLGRIMLGDFGALTPDGPFPGVEAFAAKTNFESVKLDRDEFPNKARDLKDRIENAKARLSRETHIYQEWANSMDLYAPADGLFVASVGRNGFVRMGDPVGVLQL